MSTQYVYPHDPDAGHDPGMELRDRFAGQALNGFCACQDFMNELSRICNSKEEVHRKVAKWSYDCAEAMLKEREKRKR